MMQKQMLVKQQSIKKEGLSEILLFVDRDNLYFFWEVLRSAYKIIVRFLLCILDSFCTPEVTLPFMTGIREHTVTWFTIIKNVSYEVKQLFLLSYDLFQGNIYIFSSTHILIY